MGSLGGAKFPLGEASELRRRIRVVAEGIREQASQRGIIRGRGRCVDPHHRGERVRLRVGRIGGDEGHHLLGERQEHATFDIVQSQADLTFAATREPVRLAHQSSFCIVAHKPYECIAVTSRSISSRVPLDTTARPFSCTSSMSFSALAWS